jgi:hypothetical protein
MNNPTAGSAEPYWFEWKTGLLYLIELLDFDSEIVAVAFQLHGTKGWDDVGVRLRDGTTRLLQMKHSRSGDPLTFGDLVAAESANSPSLLRALGKACKDERASRGVVECVLVTNRRGGTNWYQGRPPLAEFLDKLKARAAPATSIEQLRWEGEDERYPAAWQNFLNELSDLQDSEKLAFIQSLRIELNAPDLLALEKSIRGRLVLLTGLPLSSINALFNALVANLRTWTCQTQREKEWIDRETLRACLASDENAPAWLGHCEVETPEPFFPSRNTVVENLRLSLLANSAHKIDFLAAEPGAGKTSCISKLARSGSVFWKEQCVSIRFYAYRPIRPGQADIGRDSGVGVRPEALWLALLWQIRESLRKTHLLTQFRVPVWLDGMPWEIAREHVLRIAEALGEHWGRRFIICIDGIDHAARARRKGLSDFLATLPAPDAIPAHVRLLLSGQPPDAYPEYPVFLRQQHSAVKVHAVDTLTDEDLRVLWRAANPKLGSTTEEALIRLLAEKAQRRTLPTVYAVEPIRNCATLEEAARVLDARPLPDSLHDYYDAIWSVAVPVATDGARLAAAFALLRERPTGALLASAFADIGKSAAEWTDIMRRLRPLVRETAAGFELVHNDIRVHLDASLANEPFARRNIAAALANHYRKPASNRLAAHLSLFDLLTTAEQLESFADDFTTDWIIEAGVQGISNEQLAAECSAAFAAAVRRQDWLLLHGVACASLTLYRLEECVANADADPLEPKTVPTFLRIEGEPLPLELWSASDFPELVSACEQLVDGHAESRAAAVLKQWLGGISIETLIQRVSEDLKDSNARMLGVDAVRRDFERFGHVCALCRFLPTSIEALPESSSQCRVAIEAGWVRGLAEIKERFTALRVWDARRPHFVVSWAAAVKEAAKRERWGEVRALLNRIEGCIDDLNPADRLALGWFAARARPRNGAIWQHPLTLPNYGLAAGASSLTTLRLIAKWVTYVDGSREPAQVTEDLLPLLDRRGMDSKDPSAVALLIRASALIGRLLRYADRNDSGAAGTAVPPSTVRLVLEALWCTPADWRNLPHDEVRTPGEVAGELADIAWNFGIVYRPILRDVAKAGFVDAMLWDEGKRAFDVLWDCGEHNFLQQAVAAKAREMIQHLHEGDTASRNGIVANLLYFTERLDMQDLSHELADRLRRTRLGYTSHKEWVFQPLARWFALVRKSAPAAWRSEGMQLLALDRISEQQYGDNRFGDELTAEVAAAAMQCSAGDFEVLFDFLASGEAKHPLWDLAKAAQDGFEICLGEQQLMSPESTLARIALAVALGRWPAESALTTVESILGANGVPSVLCQQPAWNKALDVATEIQGVPASSGRKEANEQPTASPEQRSAEMILEEIIHPSDRSWINLRDIANLAKQSREENHPRRSTLIATALDALESDSMALSRCLDFHDINLMSRLYENFSETERWRLLGAITAVTGELRKQLSGEPNWAFMVAFSAVDLACRTHSADAGNDFAVAAFHQLLTTHWKWHGVSPPPSMAVRNIPTTWPDAARRILLSLLRTDACETVYMTMTGLRFYAECFPGQIPSICRAGLSDELARDAIVALAQLWATRKPESLGPVLPEFAAHETNGRLEDRLDAWAVGALHSLATKTRIRRFLLPNSVESLQVAFPGDSALLEDEAYMNGLIRHNSFAKMANMRLRRAGIALGSMDTAFRHMTRAVKQGAVEFPSIMLPPATRLAFDSSTPRHRHTSDDIVGDAILAQSAGKTWSPAKAAAVRLLIGYGMDPWISSATPNVWRDKQTWPSDFDVERWFEAGAANRDDVGLRLTALLEGHDLDPSLLLLGAILHIPTYRRDLQFDFWLAAPDAVSSGNEQSKTPTGRTLAGWLSGWSFASKSESATTVHFVGTFINYPNGDLDVTPTDDWGARWGWRVDPTNNLRFRSKAGNIVAWYERWVGPELSHRRLSRQPMLNRWVARRDSFPSQYNDLTQWTRKADVTSGLLTSPE